jgi:hypothetical protein
MNSSAIPEAPGSVAGTPHLPEGFTSTFTSRYIDTGDLRQHVVTGGDGQRYCWCTAGPRPGTPDAAATSLTWPTRPSEGNRPPGLR